MKNLKHKIAWTKIAWTKIGWTVCTIFLGACISMDSRAQEPEELARQLDEKARRLSQQGAFSGVVLLAKDGKAFFHKAYGLRNRSDKLPMAPDTKLNLGSMNKMFTAVAIAQLAEAGKLKFEDVVAKHLPEYPNKEVANQVTIHHLLTHTSGLGSYWNEKYNARFALLRELADYVPVFVDDPLQFEPGKSFGYSNVGFVVLGLVIEAASGQSYYDYVRQHIFEPAGMKNTDSYDNDAIVPNLAIGYTRQDPRNRTPMGQKTDSPWRANTYLHSAKGTSAGGGYSTAEDLLAFANALLGHKLLSPKMTQEVISPKVQTRSQPTPRHYAYGFEGFDPQDRKSRTGHTGGAPGIGSVMFIYPHQGYTAIVLTNLDGAVVPAIRAWQDLLGVN